LSSLIFLDTLQGIIADKFKSLHLFVRAHEKSRLKRALIGFYLFIATAAIWLNRRGLRPKGRKDLRSPS
jgi:hypothetical protein